MLGLKHMDNLPNLQKCFNCKGLKRTIRHLNTSDGNHIWEDVQCSVCQGVGLVSINHEKHKDPNAEKLRQWKLDKRLTIKDLSISTGFSFTQISDMLNGKCEIDNKILELINE